MWLMKKFLVVGVAVILIYPSTVTAQDFTLELGATRGLLAGAEASYGGFSGVISLRYWAAESLGSLAGYHFFTIEGEDPESGKYEVKSQVPSVGVTLRVPLGSVRPYIHAGAGVALFDHVQGDLEVSPTSLAIQGGLGLEIGRPNGVTWALEGRPLMLLTDELVNSGAVLLWPFMVGIRFHF